MKSGFFSSSFWSERGLLVHGGISSPSSQTPHNCLSLLPLKNFNKAEVLDEKGPLLSHHSSCIVTCDNQDILILIGGWTGHSRTSKVHAFNLMTKVWMELCENPKGHHRVDPPAGLSGHTATKINSSLICVIGREGGIKTQRRFGQCFLLHLELKNKSYWYTESPILPESRSGHTANLAPPNKDASSKLIVFGGREIDHLFICGKWKTDLVENPPSCKSVAKSNLEKIPFKRVPVMMGLRYHAMLVLTPDCILIHGGRHFKAISSKNVNDGFYLCSLGKKEGEESWVQLLIRPTIPRFAHTICLVNDQLFIIGGFSSEDNKEAAKIEKVSLKDTAATAAIQNDSTSKA